MSIVRLQNYAPMGNIQWTIDLTARRLSKSARELTQFSNSAYHSLPRRKEGKISTFWISHCHSDHSKEEQYEHILARWSSIVVNLTMTSFLARARVLFSLFRKTETTHKIVMEMKNWRKRVRSTLHESRYSTTSFTYFERIRWSHSWWQLVIFLLDSVPTASADQFLSLLPQNFSG